MVHEESTNHLVNLQKKRNNQSGYLWEKDPVETKLPDGNISGEEPIKETVVHEESTERLNSIHKERTEHLNLAHRSIEQLGLKNRFGNLAKHQHKSKRDVDYI